MHNLAYFFADTCAPPASGSSLVGSGCLPKAQTTGSGNVLSKAFLIAFIIIGALSFLFFVIGAARYTLSGGNADSVQKAKNQIQYSLIGLFIASLAAAIVNYVIGTL